MNETFSLPPPDGTESILFSSPFFFFRRLALDPFFSTTMASGYSFPRARNSRPASFSLLPSLPRTLEPPFFLPFVVKETDPATTPSLLSFLLSRFREAGGQQTALYVPLSVHEKERIRLSFFPRHEARRRPQAPLGVGSRRGQVSPSFSMEAVRLAPPFFHESRRNRAAPFFPFFPPD